ncbi:ankyrin repeat-containing protein [Fusarium napiforme]|uniref:Ankyrin repeat-containing protein n=1 Tax=Fusarium napiforme TaxID=42672 RepID=A0A8H5MZJ8_9HYPO|nr:ankyrin repeat-containing protein [Fusarium napiforme]
MPSSAHFHPCTSRILNPSHYLTNSSPYCKTATRLRTGEGRGHTEVVERLLAHNANPNLSDLDQITPLWKAAQYGHTSVVQLLLASEKLLDVNPRPAYLHKHKLDTPLSVAIKEGHKETAELLARADGINPCLTTDLSINEIHKISVLGLAIRGRFEDVASSLLDKCALSDYFKVAHPGRDNYGDNVREDTIEPASKLLVFAAAAGCPKIVHQLLTKHGADVNAVHGCYGTAKAIEGVRHWFEDSPLMAASRRGDLNAVRLLLDMDEVRPNVKSRFHGTALTAAAQGGFIDVVKILIADGRIEIDHKDGRGRTALSHAAESGCEAVVDELLATGAADPKSRDSRGQTPLIWATDPDDGYGPGGWQSYEGTVRRLLANSQIDVNATDRIFELTALANAARSGAIGLVKALLEHPQIDLTVEPWNTSLLAGAAVNGHVDVVKALLSTGQVDVNTAITRTFKRARRTVLMIIAEDGSVENENVAQVLLSTAGVDVNLQDEDGSTALMLAALHGKVGMAKLILASGADPNMQDCSGRTAFCYAQNAKIISTLLDEPGIKPDLPTNCGRTPLSLIAEDGDIGGVNALLASDAVDPNACDTLGRGPLSWLFGDNGLKDSCGKEERKAILQQLLRIPTVDPNAEDQNGLTPLLLAIKSEQGHEYVEILLSRPDLDVSQPLVLDTAKEIGNMTTLALLRTRCAGESIESVRPHWSQVDLPVEKGSQLSWYSMFEETQRLAPRRQSPRRSWSQGSGTASDESDFDRSGRISRSLEYLIQTNVFKEYTLCLGEQHAYVDEWAESTPNLCPACLDIDLGSAFRRRHAQYKGLVIADLGRIDETWKKRSCPLCRLFANVYPRTSLEEGHKLVSFSTSESWLCHGELILWNDFRFKRFFDTMVLAVVAANSLVADEGDKRHNENPSSHEKDVVKAAFSSGLISRLGMNGPYKGSLTIPRLATEISDWSVARGWINLCREHHSGECNPRGAAIVPHFFLIECSTRRIVEQKQSQTEGPLRYVALSYVWGQSQGGQEPLQRQNQQESLDGKGAGIVEPAIEDAICVTLELGYRYLWVDRYCIVQTGDEAIKQEQLQHMHLVYANAEVTLIAAAGEDSSAGLPGVPGRPRNQQPGALVQGHALVCIPPDPTLHIRSRSTWATRGWTHQEGLLARRRLFFSEYEMSYECRHMLCREAIRLPLGLEQRLSGYRPRHMEPFWMYQPYKVPGMDGSRTGIHLFDLLETYSRRKLSLPSDTLNAMLGIFSLLARHKTRPIYHICGVPILRLPGSHEQRSRGRSRSRIVFRSNGSTGVTATVSLGGFLDGLCWRLEEPARRRAGFPSWSWTGWQGVVARMNEDSTALKQTNGFTINISIIPGNQGCRVAVPWNRCYDSLRMADDSNPDIRSGQNHVLEITASAVTIRLHRGDYDGRPSTWIGMAYAGHRVWHGEFFLTSKDVPLSSLLRELWTGIVLGNSQNHSYTELHDTALVVIQEQKHEQARGNVQGHVYYERVGLLWLLHCTLEASMLDQQTWRLR